MRNVMLKFWAWWDRNGVIVLFILLLLLMLFYAAQTEKSA